MNPKLKAIAYWASTILVLLPTAGTGIPELFTHGPAATVQIMHTLGYPLYIMQITGLAKILGAIPIYRAGEDSGRNPDSDELSAASCGMGLCRIYVPAPGRNGLAHTRGRCGTRSSATDLLCSADGVVLPAASSQTPWALVRNDALGKANSGRTSESGPLRRESESLAQHQPSIPY